jgi:hypothetical protein
MSRIFSILKLMANTGGTPTATPQRGPNMGVIIAVVLIIITVVVVSVYFTNVACPSWGNACPVSTAEVPVSVSLTVPTPTSAPTPTPTSAPVPATPPGTTQYNFIGASQSQAVTGKLFIPLVSVYGDYYTTYARDSASTNSSISIVKRDHSGVNTWGISQDTGSGRGMGNYKFAKIDNNIMKITNIRSYSIDGYFIDASGNGIPSPYTDDGHDIKHFDLGDYGTLQGASALPDANLPREYVPKTYGCLNDEAASGENCTIPASYTGYQQGFTSMFEDWAVNPNDPTKKQRSRGFCPYGYNVAPASLGGAPNKCSYIAKTLNPSTPTAPGLEPGPVPPAPVTTGPATSCPCGKHLERGQCVNDPAGGPGLPGVAWCERGWELAPDNVTCYLIQGQGQTKRAYISC